MDVLAAYDRMSGVVLRTALQYHERLSRLYEAEIYLKREDQQPVRSYKLRGAYNKMLSLPDDERVKGIVCASAGNHAQGVAFSCRLLDITGNIFMPANTPAQKIKRVKALGGHHIKIHLEGDTYDACADAAAVFATMHQMTMVPPFDDPYIIEGQATVGLEIMEDLPGIDYLFLPIGGGGLAAGVGPYVKSISTRVKIIGAEPTGAASMTAAFEAGEPVTLDKIDPFIDGAAVRRAGALTFANCQHSIDGISVVPEGKVCATLLRLYNDDGIVTEPAGCLSIAALDDYADEIKGKKVVCVVSGGNNDSNRMDDIKKLADEWEGLQHHLIIRFHHQPDGLTEFFTKILGTSNYVNRIEYLRRDHGRSTYALLGIRSVDRQAYELLTERLRAESIEFNEVKKEDFLFKYWV